MIGSFAVSELAIGALDSGPPAVDVTGAGLASAVALAVGQGAADQTVASVAVASVGGAAVVRLDQETRQVGFATAAALASAIIRLDGASIVARVTTRVLPTVAATSEAIPLETTALASVRADRVARSSVLPLTETSEAPVLDDAVAAARVLLD